MSAFHIAKNLTKGIGNAYVYVNKPMLGVKARDVGA